MSAEDIEKSSGQNIHFDTGASTQVVISTNGIQILSGGIMFPGGSFMASAGSGSAVSISHSSDAVVNADALSSGSGAVLLEIAGNPKLVVANGGNVVISSGVAVNGRIKDQTGYVMSVGSILLYGGTTVPQGWLLCDGLSYAIASYPDLYTAIGTAYGRGGTGSFNVPDLRGMFIRGLDGIAGRDPDEASRTAMNPGGNTGNNIGSVQNDAFQGHWHNFKADVANRGGSGTYPNKLQMEQHKVHSGIRTQLQWLSMLVWMELTVCQEQVQKQGRQILT